MLAAAAVVGPEFDVADLADVVDLSTSSVQTRLRPAYETGLLDDIPKRPGAYRFSHGLLRDALLAQRKLDAAIEVYNTALEIDDKHDQARVRLAQAYLAKGDKQKAENEVAKVIARDPDNAEAKKIQAEIARSK